MIVAFANNQTMVALEDSESVITTDPHPLGDANFIEAALNVHVLFTKNGTVTLSYKIQGSNDGQSWFDVGTFSDSTTGTGLSDKGEDVTCAFVRVEFKLQTAGSQTGDISGATFDLHANFIHK